MGGGTAIICGYGCDKLDSVLGYRSCIGMVGGTVYVRGNVKDLSEEVWLMDLDDSDREYLLKGLPVFLDKIGKPELINELSKGLQNSGEVWKHQKNGPKLLLKLMKKEKLIP